MAITFVKATKTILITAPQVTATCADILSAIRTYEALPANMADPIVANSYAQQDLGYGRYIGITIQLINDWRIQYEDRAGPAYTTCYITNGLITAINAYNNEPFKASTYIYIVVEMQSNPTLTVVSDEPTASQIATAVDGLLTTNHGEGSWVEVPISFDESDIATAVDALITTSHGTGSYLQNDNIPTEAEIASVVDTVLSASHGNGSWLGTVIEFDEADIALAVDTLLSTNHGDGVWEIPGNARARLIPGD